MFYGFLSLAIIGFFQSGLSAPDATKAILNPVKADLPAPIRQGEMEILLNKQTVESDGASYSVNNEVVCRMVFKVNVYDFQQQRVVMDTATRGTCTTRMISQNGMDSVQAEIKIGGMIYLEPNGVKSFSPWYSVTVANHSPWAVTNIVSATDQALRDIQFVLENQPENFYKDARLSMTVVMRDHQ